jgi:Na+-transporting NADH:ubiquinone oxidoreductase subunit NqrB
VTVRGPGSFTRLLDPKHFIIILITLVLVVGEAKYSVLGGYDRLAMTLSVCIATELSFSWFIRGKMPSLQSAYVSGISLALLTKPQGHLLWPFALGAFLAIASKYVLQVHGRHLWNPSNFAISLILLLAPGRMSVLSHQWGNDLVTNAIIWGIGLLVVSQAKVLHVTLTYVACFLALGVIRSQIVGTPLLPEIAPITGPMYQLFVFFMVTDPRTTVRSAKGRMLVVALVALLEAAIRLASDFHAPIPAALSASPPILALAIVGPIAMWFDLRRGAAPSTGG